MTPSLPGGSSDIRLGGRQERLVSEIDGENEGAGVTKADESRNRGLDYSSVTNPVHDSFPLLVLHYPTFPSPCLSSSSVLVFV